MRKKTRCLLCAMLFCLSLFTIDTRAKADTSDYVNVEINYAHGTVKYIKYTTSATETPALSRYNCHSYVWYYECNDNLIASTPTTELLWLNTPSKYIDTSYEDSCLSTIYDGYTTSALTPSELRVGDIVVFWGYVDFCMAYFSFNHSAMVAQEGETFEDVLIKSKFGSSDIRLTSFFGHTYYTAMSEDVNTESSSTYHEGDASYNGSSVYVFRRNESHTNPTKITQKDGYKHTLSCSFCYRNETYINHTVSVISNNDEQHLISCSECGFTGYLYHDKSYEFANAFQHTVTCETCDFTTLEFHDYVVYKGMYTCVCGFTTKHPIYPNDVELTE